MGISIKKKIGWVLNQKFITPEVTASLEELERVKGPDFLTALQAEVKKGNIPKHELIGLDSQLTKVSGEDFFYSFEKGVIFCLPKSINEEWSQDDSLIDAYLNDEAHTFKTSIKKIHGSIYPYSWREWYILGTDRILSLGEIQEMKFDEEKFASLKTEHGFKAESIVKACGMVPPPLLLEVLKKGENPS